MDKAVLFEINKIIKEQEQEDDEKSDEETLSTFDKMDSFIDDEKTQSNLSIQGSVKMMSALKEPNKRNAEGLNMKAQKEKMKKLDTMKKSVEDQKKKAEDKIKLSKMQQNISNQPDVSSQTTTQTSAITEHIKKVIKKMSAPIIKRTFAEQSSPVQAPVQTPTESLPSNKAYLVKFDKTSQRPFDVKFTERGFSIEGTRLSFEALENALSKNYTITLNNGKGLILDAIKMQKILKYKDKWFNGQQ